MSFCLALFLMMVLSIVILEVDTNVTIFWGECTLKHFNTPRCIKVLKNAHFFFRYSDSLNLSQGKQKVYSKIYTCSITCTMLGTKDTG